MDAAKVVEGAAMKISWLTLLLFLASGIAWMQPKWGVEEDAVRQQGIDLLICLDVSNSMLARDVTPNRLERAKLEVLDLLDGMETDRVGLILVAGEAQRAAPLTNDFETYRNLLELASPESVFQGGTQLASALEKARGLLKAAPSQQKFVLLISDGEDRSEEAAKQAELCREEGIQVFTLGVGTVTGSKITLTDEEGAEFYLTDTDGNEVLSRFDPTTLQQISASTDGVALTVTPNVGVLRQCYQEVLLPRATQAVDSNSNSKLQRAHRFQIFLGVAILAALVSLAGFGRSKR
ncbi:MAG: VWA domain-containing protein [Planctomycetota bacterium]|nr:VWA domain-containing protein [Planctomycetota bacterium]